MGNNLIARIRHKKSGRSSPTDHESPAHGTTTNTATATYNRNPTDTTTITGPNRARGVEENPSNKANNPTITRGIDAPEPTTTARGRPT